VPARINMVAKLLVLSSIVVLSVAGYTYFTPSAVEVSTNDDEYDYVLCPTKDTFAAIWNTWSYQYLTDNPDVDVDTQMDDWNAKIIANGCDEEWLDPLDSLIEQQSASATPVFWYE